MTPPATTQNSAQPAIPKETIRQAISDGKALLKDGKTKLEAATLIFQRLKGADKATVIQAFRLSFSLCGVRKESIWQFLVESPIVTTTSVSPFS